MRGRNWGDERMRLGATLGALALLGCASTPDTVAGADADVATAGFTKLCMRSLEASGPTFSGIVEDDPLLKAGLVGPAMLTGGEMLTWRTRSGAVEIGIPVRSKCAVRVTGPATGAARNGILASAQSESSKFGALYSGPNADGLAMRDVLCRDRPDGADIILLTTSAAGARRDLLLLNAVTVKGACADQRASSAGFAMPKSPDPKPDPSS